MFKLIKILNSGANTPEPIILPKSYVFFKQGELLCFIDGELTKLSSTTMPTHIALAAVAEEDAEAVCAEITPDMIFECPVAAGTPSTLIGGAKVCLEIKDDTTVGVNTTTALGVATVYNAMAASAIGDKILVRFN